MSNQEEALKKQQQLMQDQKYFEFFNKPHRVKDFLKFNQSKVPSEVGRSFDEKVLPSLRKSYIIGYLKWNFMFAYVGYLLYFRTKVWWNITHSVPKSVVGSMTLLMIFTLEQFRHTLSLYQFAKDNRIYLENLVMSEVGASNPYPLMDQSFGQPNPNYQNPSVAQNYPQNMSNVADPYGYVQNQSYPQNQYPSYPTNRT